MNTVLEDLKISVDCMRRADVPGPYEWRVPLGYARELYKALRANGVEIEAPDVGDEMDINVADTEVRMQVC